MGEEAVVATGSATESVASGQEGNSWSDANENALSRVLGQLSQKYEGTAGNAAASKSPSLNDIVSQVEAKGRAETNPPPEPKKAPAPPTAPKKPEAPKSEDGTELADGAPKPPEQPVQKKKYAVHGEEYELTPDQADRYAQKGIYYEKKGIEFARKEQELAQRESQLKQQGADTEVLLKALAQDPAGVLRELYGDDVIERLKPAMAERIRKEQEYEQNPHLRELDAEKTRAAQLEQQLKQREQQEYNQKVETAAAEYKQKYHQTVIQALEMGGIPKTPEGAHQVLQELRLLQERGIEATPQQLAERVKQSNVERVHALTGTIAEQIDRARAENRQEDIVKHGEQLAELLGRPVVYALAKYHLAQRLQSRPAGTGALTKPPEQPRVNPEPQKPKRPMDLDEYMAKAKERAARLQRGEEVEDW